jgi:hypothetical protein
MLHHDQQLNKVKSKQDYARHRSNIRAPPRPLPPDVFPKCGNLCDQRGRKRFIASWGLRMLHICPCTPCPSPQGYRSKVESRHFAHHCMHHAQQIHNSGAHTSVCQVSRSIKASHAPCSADTQFRSSYYCMPGQQIHQSKSCTMLSRETRSRADRTMPGQQIHQSKSCTMISRYTMSADPLKQIRRHG